MPDQAAKKVVVLGAGITGLAAAYRIHRLSLQQKVPIELLVLEGESRAGGSLHSSRRDGFLLEGGPDCFISSKTPALILCEELGLSGELLNTIPEFRQSFIVRGGKLHPIPEGFYLLAPTKLRPFLRSPLLSWKGKFRAILEPLIRAKPQDEESLAAFVRRRLGNEVLTWLAQPLVAGIYSADPERLSLRATFPQFLAFEKKYGSVLLGLAKQDKATQSASGARYSLFVSFRPGMETFAKTLVAKLPAGALRFGSRVREVRRNGGGWQLTIENAMPIRADALCLCTGANAAAALLEQQDRHLAGLLRTIPYASSITINLAFDRSQIKHPLNGVGFVTPDAESDLPIACTFVHRKFAGRVPEGKALLRAYLGGRTAQTWTQAEDQKLVSVALEKLRPLLSITGQAEWASVERWRDAMPQYTTGHLNSIVAMEEAALGLPGLTLAGNWQYGIGIPDCIESGERAAQKTINDLVRSENAPRSTVP